MKTLKPVHISILTLVVFVIALLIGMQSDWWITEGRKTPLDGVTRRSVKEHDELTEDEHSEEEGEHEKTEVTGGSTVQDAIDLGIPIEKIEEVLEGEIKNTDALIKNIVAERGLKFGIVKDTLNRMIP